MGWSVGPEVREGAIPLHPVPPSSGVSKNTNWGQSKQREWVGKGFPSEQAVLGAECLAKGFPSALCSEKQRSDPKDPLVAPCALQLVENFVPGGDGAAPAPPTSGLEQGTPLPPSCCHPSWHLHALQLQNPEALGVWGDTAPGAGLKWRVSRGRHSLGSVSPAACKPLKILLNSFTLQEFAKKTRQEK